MNINRVRAHISKVTERLKKWDEADDGSPDPGYERVYEVIADLRPILNGLKAVMDECDALPIKTPYISAPYVKRLITKAFASSGRS